MPTGVPIAGEVTKKPCRYCHEQFGSNNLLKHEARCKGYTPEQRRKLTLARESYYRGKALKKNGTEPNYHTTKGRTFEIKACRYCHEPISVNSLVRHEDGCKDRTPEQRAKARQARMWAHSRNEQQKNNLDKFRASAVIPVAPKRVGRPPGSKSQHRTPHRSGFVFANGNGRRLTATISVDFKSFRQLLLELAPLLSIDKVEVV